MILFSLSPVKSSVFGKESVTWGHVYFSLSAILFYYKLFRGVPIPFSFIIGHVLYRSDSLLCQTVIILNSLYSVVCIILAFYSHFSDFRLAANHFFS